MMIKAHPTFLAAVSAGFVAALAASVLLAPDVSAQERGRSLSVRDPRAPAPAAPGAGEAPGDDCDSGRRRYTRECLIHLQPTDFSGTAFARETLKYREYDQSSWRITPGSEPIDYQNQRLLDEGKKCIVSNKTMVAAGQTTTMTFPQGAQQTYVVKCSGTCSGLHFNLRSRGMRGVVYEGPKFYYPTMDTTSSRIDAQFTLENRAAQGGAEVTIFEWTKEFGRGGPGCEGLLE